LARPLPEVETKVRQYLQTLGWALPAALIFTAYRGFNTAVSRPKASQMAWCRQSPAATWSLAPKRCPAKGETARITPINPTKTLVYTAEPTAKAARSSEEKRATKSVSMVE